MPINDEFGRSGVRQKSANFPHVLGRARGVIFFSDGVRTEDTKGVPVITPDDCFNLLWSFHGRKGHRRYYGKEWRLGPSFTCI